jgi:hypothetical protein
MKSFLPEVLVTPFQDYPEQNPKLRAVDGKSYSWKNDPDYFSKYYLGSQSKDNLGNGTSVRLDLGVAVAVSHLIASKAVPYKDTSEFLRDSATKMARWYGDNLDHPEIKKLMHMVEVNAQAIHDEKVMEQNERLLKSRKKQLDNAESMGEIKRVLESCKDARQHFEGKQKKALDALITECEERLK